MAKLPKYFNQTMRQYKKQKRKEFKKALAAMREVRLGCICLPPSAFQQFETAMKCLEKAHEDCKVWWSKA